MAIVDGSLQLGYKDTAWFTANASLVLLVGQIVYLEQTGTYKLGDGVTALSALSFLGGNGLAYTPEDVANKSTSVNTDQASNTKYPSVKAVYDWAIGLFVKKGTLTTNYIPKATASDTIGNSPISYDSSGNLMLGQSGKATTTSTTFPIYGGFGDSLETGYLGVSNDISLLGRILLKASGFTIISDDGANGITYYGFSGHKFSVGANVKALGISSTGVVDIQQLTASQIVETDASKNLVSVGYSVSNLLNFDKDKNNFRLTLTSGVAVTTTDVVNSQTIYCTPFNGNVISLYNGINWVLYESSEFSLALGTLATGNYDVFCYANAGVPALEFLAWTNDTTRATNFTLLDGIKVKSGDSTRRLVGSFYNPGNKSSTVTISNGTPCVITYTGHGLTANAPVVFTTTGALPSGIVAGNTYYLASLGTATANTFNISATPGGALINTTTAGSGTHTCTVATYTEDSEANRFLENADNQVLRRMYRAEQTTSWDYNGVRRQMNANLLNQLNFINCLEGIISATAITRVGCSVANTSTVLGIGLDNTTSTNIGKELVYFAYVGSATLPQMSTIDFNENVTIGSHYLSMIEFSASATTRWYGGTSLYTQITGFKLG